VTPSMAERTRTIERLLWEQGRVTVDELSALFGVSAVTVRQDLAALEQEGRLTRIRGGAVQADAGSSSTSSFDARARDRLAEKRAIAARAAELVRDGDTIILDCSTTAYHLARCWKDRRNLVVITNGLRVAQALGDNPSTTVIMPGGTLHSTAQSLIGGFTDALDTFGTANWGFFSPWAVNPALGYMDINAGEAAFKERLIASCRNTVALFDSSKASDFAFIPVAGFDRVDHSISDSGLASAAIEAIKAAGQQLTLVEVPSRR